MQEAGQEPLCPQTCSNNEKYLTPFQHILEMLLLFFSPQTGPSCCSSAVSSTTMMRCGPLHAMSPPPHIGLVLEYSFHLCPSNLQMVAKTNFPLWLPAKGPAQLGGISPWPAARRFRTRSFHVFHVVPILFHLVSWPNSSAGFYPFEWTKESAAAAAK